MKYDLADHFSTVAESLEFVDPVFLFSGSVQGPSATRCAPTELKCEERDPRPQPDEIKQSTSDAKAFLVMCSPLRLPPPSAEPETPERQTDTDDSGHEGLCGWAQRTFTSYRAHFIHATRPALGATIMLACVIVLQVNSSPNPNLTLNLTLTLTLIPMLTCGPPAGRRRPPPGARPLGIPHQECRVLRRSDMCSAQLTHGRRPRQPRL